MGPHERHEDPRLVVILPPQKSTRSARLLHAEQWRRPRRPWVRFGCGSGFGFGVGWLTWNMTRLLVKLSPLASRMRCLSGVRASTARLIIDTSSGTGTRICASSVKRVKLRSRTPRSAGLGQIACQTVATLRQ